MFEEPVYICSWQKFIELKLSPGAPMFEEPVYICSWQKFIEFKLSPGAPMFEETDITNINKIKQTE
jgi:hypothetical protein